MFVKIGDKIFNTAHISAVRPSGNEGYSHIRMSNGYEYTVDFDVDDVLYIITNGDMA